MTKTEIIQETANYYKTSNRSTDVIDFKGTVTCVYENERGNRCAVGRCMTDDGIKRIKQLVFNKQVGVEVLNLRQPIDSFLKEEYRGHDIGFWCHLQIFHDSETYWNENGMTENGEDKLIYLLNKYKKL